MTAAVPDTARPAAPAPRKRAGRRPPVLRRPVSLRDAATGLATRVWFAPGILMLALSLWRIGTIELWQDELVSLDISRRTTTEILHTTQNVDGVHRFYYLILHYWVRVFGDSVTSLRMPSVLAMLGATVCVALVGRRLFGRSAGLAAGLVYALVPTTARFAQEARSYAFIMFGAALATLLLLRALESPRWQRWVPYGLAAVFLGYVHVVAMTLFAAHGLVVLAVWRRDRDRRLLLGFAGACVAAVVAILPVIALGSAQQRRQIHWIKPIQPGVVFPVWTETLGSAALAGFLVLAGLLALGRLGRPAVTIAVIAVVPLPVVLLASLGSENYYFPKYLMFTIPAWAVMAGAGLTALGGRRALALALAAMALLVATDQRELHRALSHIWYSYPDREVLAPLDYRGAADVVARGYQPGDAVAYDRLPWWWSVDVGVGYYLPADVHLRDVFEARTPAQNNDIFAIECGVAAACLGDAPRLWVVDQGLTPDPLSPLPSNQQNAIRAKYRRVSVAQVPGMTVGLYVLARG